MDHKKNVGISRTIIKPKRGWVNINIRELWLYRELFFFLAWRDISIRYKQTMLGAAWAIIQPLFTMVVFSLFFGKLANIPSDGIPYPIFSFAALLPWQYFSSAMSHASNSLVDNSSLLTKVYFPRLVIPVSSIFPPLVDFCLAFMVLLGMMMFYDVSFSLRIIFVPAFLLLAMIAALGLGLCLTALNVKYRDIRYAVPFLMQLWMFASPVVYPSSLIPEKWRILYGLNPMTGVIEGIRWSLIGTKTEPGAITVVSIGISFTMLIAGVFYFLRAEKNFADVV